MKSFKTINELYEYKQANGFTIARLLYDKIMSTHKVYSLLDKNYNHAEEILVSHIEISKGRVKKILKMNSKAEAIERYYERDEDGDMECVWEDYIAEGIWDLTKKQVKRNINKYLDIKGVRYFYADDSIMVLDSIGEMIIIIELNGLCFI